MYYYVLLYIIILIVVLYIIIEDYYILLYILIYYYLFLCIIMSYYILLFLLNEYELFVLLMDNLCASDILCKMRVDLSLLTTSDLIVTRFYFHNLCEMCKFCIFSVPVPPTFNCIKNNNRNNIS